MVQVPPPLHIPEKQFRLQEPPEEERAALLTARRKKVVAPPCVAQERPAPDSKQERLHITRLVQEGMK